MKTAPNTETSIPERTPSSPRYPTEITVLVFILILAAALRFYGLGYQGLWNDELASWAMSNKDSLGEVLSSAYQDNHPPGYHFFLYFVIRLFGDSEISLRFPLFLFFCCSFWEDVCILPKKDYWLLPCWRFFGAPFSTARWPVSIPSWYYSL